MGRLDPNASSQYTQETHDQLGPADTNILEGQDLYEPAAAAPTATHDYNYEKPQPFPPPQEPVFEPHDHYNFQQQPNNVNNIGMHHQFQQQQPAFGQPAVGVAVGTSPSPFINIPNQQNQPWKTDLFGCMDDPQNAIITLLFPCVTFGQVAEILDSGSSSCGTSGMLYGVVAFCIAMPCIMSCTYRTKLRSRFGLIETPAPDWLVHCFCEHCALCQIYRELNQRGLDPSIGWMGNVAKQQQRQQFGMTPPMQQRMN
ncbi:protein plant cadmium resistance 6 [Phtheirospermum japonicum]|uniref:Protein plant cadmium resistance 6 n=1 Tax=Phtheirospermum japonicum TaxID=374723 RepID=A0A830CHL9_9LAMI|nr:protein plant cadmium resistance 6 [Phtheirospermum japonicum]